MNKRVVAKEWIVFFSSVCFGVFILPLILIFFLRNIVSASSGYAAMSMLEVYDKAFHSSAVFMMAIAPYIAVQLARSVIWAAKNVKVE